MRLTSQSRFEKRRQRERSTRRRMLMEQLERREVLTGLPPAVMNDAFSVNPDQILNVDAPGILANDTDAEGDFMSAVLFSGPQHGTLSLDTAGSFSYTPDAGYVGIDSFIYRADDGTSLSGLAAVTIRVETNDSPVAADDTFNMSEGTVLSIGSPGVLTNDSDANGDALSAELVAGPANGALTLNADGSFDYTPNAGFTGADSFTYAASDGISSSSTATVTINVNNVNAIPEIGNDSFTADEDTPLIVDAAGGLLANDSDADDDPLTAVLVTGPAHGTLTLNGDGSFEYIPGADFNGLDGFSYLVNDGTDDSDVATVMINVNAVNDLPTAVNDEFTTEEDTPLTVSAPGMLENDSDIDGDSLSSILVSGPANGTLSVNADGSFEYTPNADFSGVDGFAYKVSDGTGESDVATVTINVTPVNDLPTAADDAYSTDEDTALVIAAPGLLANDADPDGDSLAALVGTGPVNGTLTLNADGSFEYTPNADFSGTDSFTYTANDAAGASIEATVTITVNAVNDAPTAAEDTYSTDEDAALTIAAPGVLANDTDPEGDPLTAVLGTGPTNGTVTLNADGSFVYTPNADFSGSDSFTYKSSDGTAESAETTVSITVNSVNDAPAATDDAYATDEDTALVIAAPGVLTNDTDPEGDALSAILVGGPTSGTVTLNADGSFEYTPNADFSGVDSFTYKTSDGTADSGEATVTITVNSVNDAPVAANDEYSTDEDVALNIPAPGIMDNDSDSDGDPLSATVVAGPANGTVTVNPDGSFTYTPNADFTGVDGFSYQVSDGTATSDVATVTINVCPINDAPSGVEDTYSTDEDTALVIAAPGVLGNDTDPDGDPLTAILGTGPANGTVTLNADGSFEYTPSADFSGSDSFTYKVSDGTTESAETTVSITVNPTNDAPTAAEDAYSTDEDTALAIAAPGVLGNDTDPDGDPLTAILGTGPTNGTVTLNADGSFEYTPSANFSGSDSFTYKVSDGTTESAETTVSITVNPTNDAPTAAEDAYSTDEDTALVIAAPGLLGNDTDPDGDPLTAILGTGPANGTVTVNADGSFEYTPSADFSGSDSFTYKVSDGTTESAETTVSITVNPTNDGPVSAADAYSIDENLTLTVDSVGGVLANDTDPDGDVLSAILVTGPTNGSLTLEADGSFEYTPTSGFSGTDTFTYKANDGTADGAETTVTITVNDVNSAPGARNDSYSMAEDGTLTTDAVSGVLRNDTDAEGDALSAMMVDGPAHGTLTLNADGSFSYQPDADFNGQDTFTYQANDGTESSETVTVTINVNSVNDAPVSEDDEYLTLGGDTLTTDAAGGVLANDSDVEGDTLTVTLIQGPNHGSLTLNSDGSFTYTPETGFSGEDTFTYQVNDGEADGNVATVKISVDQGTNESPVAGDDSLSVVSGNTLDVAAPGILANDSDGDGDTLTASLVAGPANGSLTLNADGSLSYTPNAGFTGADTFTYMANDGTGDSNVATVTIDVQAAAPVPRNVVGVNDRYELEQDTTLSIAAPGVLANDTDADSDAMTAELFSDVQHGTLVLNADGSFDYTPDAGYVGTDSFVYRATDGSNFSLLTAVTLRIAASGPEPAPVPAEVVGVNDSYSLVEDTQLSIEVPGVLANDTDASGDPLTAELFLDVQNGSLTLDADGSFDYTPDAGFVGSDSFVYRATDGANFSLLTAVTLRVTAAPDQSPIPEPAPNPCTCDDSEEESGDALLAPQSDPLDSLAIVEGDTGEDLGDVLDDVIEDVVEDDEEETDSVDEFFTTVGSCA
jgi:VCBS repeat-containing protein